MTKNQNKNYLWGLAALASAVAALTLLVWSPPALKSQAALASYFELSTSLTPSGTDNSLTMNVGDEEEVFLLLDTNAEYITAADVEITYDSTYLGITNGSGATASTLNVTRYPAELNAVGSYSNNAVTAVGSGSAITVSWGADTDETYQTSGTSDVFASFYIEAQAETTTATTMSFDFTQGEDHTTDTDATRTSGTGGTTIDTLADCYNLSVTINSALDMSLSKEADEEVYEYDPDDTTEIEYTITVGNDDTADSTVDFEDDIGDAMDDFFDELDSSDVDDIRQDLLDSVDLSPSTAASTNDIDDTDSDLNDGTFDITDLTVADGAEVEITYTLTIPEDLDLDSFNWNEEDRYGDDINDEDIDTSNNDYDDEDEAIGEPDDLWVSLGEDGEIVIELADGMYVVNGDNEDVRVYEVDDLDVDTDVDDEEYEVSFSANCTSSFQDADNEESDSADFDLDDTNLNYARCIKITDTSNADGDAPGVDIDAIAILNVGRVLDNTATVTASNDETVTGTSSIVVNLATLFTEDVPDIDEDVSDDDDIVPPPPVVSRLAVSCTPNVMAVGATATCTALYTDATTGTITDVSANPLTLWSTDNLSILTVNGRQITGVNAGAAYVAATYNGYSGSALITVTAAVLPTTGSGLNAALVLAAVLLSTLAYGLQLAKQKN